MVTGSFDTREERLHCIQSAAIQTPWFDRLNSEEERCALAPADLLLIYSDGVTEAMNGEGDFFGDAHLLNLADGLPNNVNRALPETLDARLDRGAWTVPPIFDFLRERGNVEPDEMDRVFNMGVGYTLIVRPTFADSVVRQLRRLGETAFVMGEITKGRGRVQWR